jgi:RecA-family ATPase
VDLIKERIRQFGYKLFLIDPLIEFHDAKEDTQGLHAIGAVLREIAHDCDCAVLFFHHTPKTANSDTAAGDMNAMRGGGPIVGVARFVGTMFGMTVKDAEEYGIAAKERVRYVRFDDAKANMALVSAEPQWWIKLGSASTTPRGQGRPITSGC